jgi:hypothetical protein
MRPAKKLHVVKADPDKIIRLKLYIRPTGWDFERDHPKSSGLYIRCLMARICHSTACVGMADLTVFAPRTYCNLVTSGVPGACPAAL